MKLEQFTIFRPSIEMDRSFVTSLRRVDRLETVLIRTRASNGAVGWGEAPISPQVTGETPDGVLSALDVILPDLLDKDPRDREKLHGMMDRKIAGNTAAKAAIDISIHDLLGSSWGVPLWKLFGGAHSTNIPTDFTVSLEDKSDMIERAGDLVEKGFTSLKVKLGETPKKDVERMRGIVGRVGKEIGLRIDANQGWDRIQAASVLRQLEGMNVEFVEQPLKAEDLEGMKNLRENTAIPIMADESVHGPDSARNVIKFGAADYINIKLSKTGGFWPALKVAAIAEGANVSCMVGGMSATDLLATAASHFAAGQEIVRFRDLDMGTSISNSVIATGGSYIEGGTRFLESGGGLGIGEIDRELIGPGINDYSV